MPREARQGIHTANWGKIKRSERRIRVSRTGSTGSKTMGMSVVRMSLVGMSVAEMTVGINTI
jgi:hypothetical protein